MTFNNKTLTSLLLAVLITATAQAAVLNVGTVLVSDLRMRSGPGTVHSVMARLKKGDQFPILGDKNGWYKIEYNGLDGYVLGRKDFIAVRTQNELKNSAPDAETIKEQIRQTQLDLKATTHKEMAAIEEFDTAETALDKTRQQIRTVVLEMAQLKTQIVRIEEQYQDLEQTLKNEESYAARRLTALYKLNWVGRIQLLATAESFFDFIQRRSALTKILAQDEALLESLNNDKISMETILTQLNTKKAEKHALELILNDRLKLLSDQQKQRTALLDKIKGEKALELAALKSLHQAAMNLNVVVDQLKPSAKVADTTPDTDKPFSFYKGLLSLPVKGKIVSFFGPYQDKKYAVTNFQSGIDIQAERGEPIRCVSDGHTIYANWFKGFGNMIIVDHGNHYYTVYAHLEEVFKVKGDHVEKNEVIATVGDSGSMMGPALHFEVRHHGKPVDPMEWIRKG